MTTDSKRVLLACAIALDLVVVATGVAGLFPVTSELLFLPYVGAVAAAAWISGAEIGLAATAISVLSLAIRFPNRVDASLLTVVTVCGALLSVALGALKNRSFTRALDSAPAPAGSPVPGRKAAFYAVSSATPLLVIIIYANLSDLLMRVYATPSLLQPMLALLVVAIWWLRRDVRPSEVILQPLTLLLAAYCFFLFVSSIWAGDLAASDDRFMEGLKNLTIFIVAGSLVGTWRVLRGAMVALTLTAALLAALTIVQTVTGTHYEFGGLASLKAGNVYADVSELRASGPLDDPNFYAQLLLLALPLAGFVLYTEKRPAVRTVYLIAILMIGAGALLTYSRGAMVALTVMIVFVLFLFRVRMTYVIAAAVGVFVALSLLPSAVTRRFSTVQALLPGQERVVQEDASIEERKLFLASAWRMFDDHPLVGVGAGNFNTFYHRYADIVGSPARLYRDRGDVAYPHMLYLQIAAETGLTGLVLFLAAAAAAFRALLKAFRRLRNLEPQGAAVAIALIIALLGYLVTALFLHGSYQRDLWLILAFVAAVTRLAAKSTGVRLAGAEVRG